MKKRLTAAVLVFLMLLTLAGCSKKNDTSDNENITDVSDTENSTDTGDTTADTSVDTPDEDTSEGEDETENGEEPVDDSSIKVAFNSGDSAVGGAWFIEENKNSSLSTKYAVTIYSSVSDITDAIISGKADIAMVPTSVAPKLYNETDGNIRIAEINTYSSLYMLENGNTVRSIYDMAGRTIYLPNDGANTQYAIEGLLNSAGYDIDENVFVEYMDTDDLISSMIDGKIELCVLDAVSVAKVLDGNENIRCAFDIYGEWKSELGYALTHECIVVRSDTVSDEALESFLSDYKNSVDFMSDVGNLQDAESVMTSCGIVSSETVAERAINLCNFQLISDTDDMLDTLTDFYQMLYRLDSDAIGGSVPDDAFYR
jgi:NitT/TauT family transport system substrate-binding protein